MGEFDDALEILEEYGNTYPDQSRMSLMWKQLQCQIRHQKQRQRYVYIHDDVTTRLTCLLEHS